MKDFTSISERWLDMWELKEEFAYGDSDINLEAFKELVKDTYYLIVEMHKIIEKNDYSEITPAIMREYIDLVSCISLYGAPGLVDQSEDNSFTITRLLAFDLADLGANYSLYAIDEDEPLVEGTIVSLEAFNYGLNKEIHYDVNKGDISEYIEFASVVCGY